MREERPFASGLEKKDILLGGIYLPFHILALPQLLELLGARNAWLTPGWESVIWYGLGFVYLVAVLFRWLREQFLQACDHVGTVLWNVAGAYALYYFLALGAQYLLTLLGADPAANPNNAGLLSLTGQDYRFVRAIALFVAPVVEEVLFRGIVFGALRERSRLLALAASIGLFALYHLWRYAAAGDFSALIYGIQYIPASLVLCLCYERTGSIWTAVLFHMVNNFVGYAALG